MNIVEFEATLLLLGFGPPRTRGALWAYKGYNKMLGHRPTATRVWYGIDGAVFGATGSKRLRETLGNALPDGHYFSHAEAIRIIKEAL